MLHPFGEGISTCLKLHVKRVPAEGAKGGDGIWQRQWLKLKRLQEFAIAAYRINQLYFARFEVSLVSARLFCTQSPMNWQGTTNYNVILLQDPQMILTCKPALDQQFPIHMYSYDYH